MAKDQFGFGTEIIKWGERKESDYGKINADKQWTYDGSINYNAKDQAKEAVKYLGKNIPYMERQMDNTEYLDVWAYMITKQYGLNAWKNSVDKMIMETNPMNQYDEDGKSTVKHGSGDLSLIMEKDFPDLMNYEDARDEYFSLQKKR